LKEFVDAQAHPLGELGRYILEHGNLLYNS
jgi:hypothetical protein